MHFLLLQNCEAENLGRYQRRLGSSKHTMAVLPTEKRIDPWPEDFDAVLVAGTPICALDTAEHPFLESARRFLDASVSAGKPYLGVCFGGQLLSLMLGGDVHRGANTEIGSYETELTPTGMDDPLFAGFPDRFPVFQWHSDTFDPPDTAQILAIGDDGTPQAFRRGTAVGLQFHLEVSTAEAKTWTQKYEDELHLVGKTNEDVIEECRKIDGQMDELARLLIDNFIGLIG